jgi:hypothetical protein
MGPDYKKIRSPVLDGFLNGFHGFTPQGFTGDLPSGEGGLKSGCRTSGVFTRYCHMLFPGVAELAELRIGVWGGWPASVGHGYDQRFTFPGQSCVSQIVDCRVSAA